MIAAVHGGRGRARPALVVLLLAGVAVEVSCTVGPEYKRPAAPVPAAYKENSQWQPAQPGDNLPRGKW